MADWHDQFPAPVHTEDEEAGVWVHRNISIEHCASPDCPCCPVYLLERDFADYSELGDKLNALDLLN